MRKKLIVFIAEVSIFSAIALVLDFVAGIYSAALWPNGGSVTLAFIPIFIMGYRHGLKGGLLTGLLVGVLQLLWSNYLLNFWQICLDYIIPNVVLGLVGLFSKQVKEKKGIVQLLFIVIPIIIIGILRLTSLTFSGLWFWQTGFIASIIYNGIYTGLSTLFSLIITIVILKLLPKEYLIN